MDKNVTIVNFNITIKVRSFKLKCFVSIIVVIIIVVVTYYKRFFSVNNVNGKVPYKNVNK